MPGDVHRLWMGRLDKELENNGQDKLDYSSMSSYTASSAGPLQCDDSRVRQAMAPSNTSGSGFSDETTTLDQLGLEIGTQLKRLNDLKYIGYDYLKPMGLDKTMAQIADEQQAAAAELASGTEYPEREAAVEPLESVNVDMASNGEVSSVLERDLDANIEDRDSLTGDVHDDAEGFASATLQMTAADISVDGSPVDADSAFFMAAEEYQTDHGVVEPKQHGSSFLGNSSFAEPADPITGTSGPLVGTSGPISGSTGPTTGPTSVTSGPVVSTVATTPDIETETSDHDMTVE